MALYTKSSYTTPNKVLSDVSKNPYLPQTGTTLSKTKYQTGLTPTLPEPTAQSYRKPVLPASDVMTKQLSNMFGTGAGADDVANRARQFAVNQYGNPEQSQQSAIDNIMYKYKTEDGRKKALSDLMGLTTDVEYLPNGNRISAVSMTKDDMTTNEGQGYKLNDRGVMASNYNIGNNYKALSEKYGVPVQEVMDTIYSKGTGVGAQDMLMKRGEYYLKMRGLNDEKIAEQMGKDAGETYDYKPMNDFQSEIDALRDAIKQRSNTLRDQATESSRLNQEDIQANLRRIYGANVDTSGVNPILAERGRLDNRLRDITTAENQSIAEQDISLLDRLRIAQKEQQAQIGQEEQAKFDRAIQEAGLTGMYNGAPTLSNTKAQDLRDKAQMDAEIKRLTEEGKNTRADELLQYRTGVATGNIGGQDTLELMKALGYIDGAATLGTRGLDEKIRQFESLFGIKEGALTGYYEGQDTLGRETLEERIRAALANESLSGERNDIAQERLYSGGGSGGEVSDSTRLSALTRLTAIEKSLSDLDFDKQYMGLSQENYDRQKKSLLEQRKVAEGLAFQ
jgi:hypothetical protein